MARVKAGHVKPRHITPAPALVGKGTYYPGRTKPLAGLKLSRLAQRLQRDRFTFASPCGKKGQVYKIGKVGDPGLFHYALHNDRIMHHRCRDVGKTRGPDGSTLMPNGYSVPVADLSVGLAVFFGIKGKAGIGQFRLTLVPETEHAAILAQMSTRVATKARR